MATLTELIRECGELGARENQFKSDLRGWLNRGQRAIAQRKNWTFMFDRPAVTIAAGDSSANLPENFKELAPEKPQVTVTDLTQSVFPRPVHVKTRAELERLCPGWEAYTVGATGYTSPFYVFLEQVGGGRWTINVPVGYPLATDVTYNVSAYFFPSVLTTGDDHNALTDDAELAEALVNWVKWKAWSSDPTDARGPAAVALYEQAMQRALGQDSRRRIAGLAMRM